MSKRHKLLAKIHKKKPVGNYCTWPGTIECACGRLQVCGQEAVGSGLFCDPSHQHCELHDLCERHAVRGLDKPYIVL